MLMLMRCFVTGVAELQLPYLTAGTPGLILVKYVIYLLLSLLHSTANIANNVSYCHLSHSFFLIIVNLCQ